MRVASSGRATGFQIVAVEAGFTDEKLRKTGAITARKRK
jgi:hypothetical protein